MVLERIVCESRLQKLLNGHNGNGHSIDPITEVIAVKIEPTTVPVAEPIASEPKSIPEEEPVKASSVPLSLSPTDLDFFAQNPTPPPYISNSFVVSDDNKPLSEQAKPTPPVIKAETEVLELEPIPVDTSPNPFNPVAAPAEIASTDKSSAITDTPAPVDSKATNIKDVPPPPPPFDHSTDNSHATKLFHVFGQLMTFVENGVEIAGHKRSFAGFAIGFVVLLFVGNLLFNSICGFVSSFSSLPTIGQPSNQYSLGGQWVINYVYRGRPFQGRMIVQQSGNQLAGYGRDPIYFEFSGTKSGNQVHLNKVYLDPVSKNRIGFPVTLDGVITQWGDNHLNIHGIYVASMKQGVFLHAHVTTIEGNWQADLVSTAVPKFAPTQQRQQGSNFIQQSTSFIPNINKTEEFQGFLMKIAGVFLFIGFAIVMASFKLFGPNGLVNIWAKKEYIPSQFKSSHNKMIWEMGKPIRPGSVPLGDRIDWSILQFYKPKKLAIPKDLRNTNPHILILGGGDKGKSRLMANMIAHDIQDHDRAVVVIDSDGGLVDLILRWITSQPHKQHYVDQVMLIDPTHSGSISPAYNPLEMPEDGDLQAAASAIVFGFKAVYTEAPGSQTQWNQQTANILRNAALLLMVNGKTLTDLPVLLSDNDFRDVLLDNIEKRKDEHVEFISLLETWNQYKRLARTDQWINWVEPILNRVTPMLSDSRIRSILTKPKGDLNLRNVISQGKTLLVKVPHGHLDQNADLLGSLIVTGLKQAALSLANSGNQQHPCALYLDEFDNFIEKETFEACTHETSKFQLGLTCAVKTLQHLPEDFRNQLSINVGTICAFALGKKDADMLGPQMFRVDGRKIKHQTMQNIFNRVNSSFHFELISDEEKLNIDRVIGLEEKTYFCYRVGTIAGVFLLKAFDFPDIPDDHVDHALIKQLYTTDNVRQTKTVG
jgi:hypothetical protein